MSLLDVLDAMVIYFAVYWLLGPLLLMPRHVDDYNKYIFTVAGLHAITFIALVAVGIVLSIEWAIRKLF